MHGGRGVASLHQGNGASEGDFDVLHQHGTVEVKPQAEGYVSARNNTIRCGLVSDMRGAFRVPPGYCPQS
jgi:hypothetical protein